MLYSTSYKIICDRCTDVSEGEGTKSDAKYTARANGWSFYLGDTGMCAECPECVQKFKVGDFVYVDIDWFTPGAFPAHGKVIEIRSFDGARRDYRVDYQTSAGQPRGLQWFTSLYLTAAN